MLADQKVQLGVVGHPVGLVGRLLDDGNALPRSPLAARIGGHVGEDEVAVHRVPQRPLGEGEAGPQQADGGVFLDDVAEEAVRDRFMCHGLAPLLANGYRARHPPPAPAWRRGSCPCTPVSRQGQTGNQGRFGRVSVIGPGTVMPSRPTTFWRSIFAGRSWMGSRKV